MNRPNPARKWYKKKRYLGAALLVIWLVFAYSEGPKMRYEQNSLKQQLLELGQENVHFHQKQVDGRTVNYLSIIKNDTLPIVVFAHGSPGSLSDYEPYLQDTVFGKDLNFIAIDRPGFGYSNFGQAEGSLQYHADAMAAVVEDYPDAPKIAVGHSMGGPVIAKAAMEYPAHFRGLVFVAPSVSPALEPATWWRKLLNIPPIRWLAPPAFRVCNQEIIPLRGELEIMENDWKDLKIPVTVVQGEMDRLVPAGNADFIQDKMINGMKTKVVMLKGKDHFILWSEVPMIKTEILEVVEMVQSHQPSN
ncbi:MAG: alpha/beta fold hydrolase [Bacteroidota bacterium]